MNPALVVALSLFLGAPHVANDAVTPSAARPGAKREARRDPERDEKRDGSVEVPIDVGVGLIALVPSPPLFNDQIAFTGITLDVAAVIDKKLIREHRAQIPPRMRRMAMGLSEVKYRPWFLALVPNLLVISPAIPAVSTTGMYGAVWRPLGIGANLVDTRFITVSANVALDVAYVFIHSDTRDPTHFLRPGVNGQLLVEVPVTTSLIVATGWSSDFYLPQPLGRPPWEFTPIEDTLWHLGGPFVQLHVRFPYATQL